MPTSMSLELKVPDAPYTIKVRVNDDVGRTHGTVFHPSHLKVRQHPSDPMRALGEWISGKVVPGQVITFNGHPGEAYALGWGDVVDDDRSEELRAAHEAQWDQYKAARARWLRTKSGQPPERPDPAAALVMKRRSAAQARAQDLADGPDEPGAEFPDEDQVEELGEGDAGGEALKATRKKATAKGRKAD